MSKLVRIKECSEQTGISVRALRHLKQQRKIPYIHAGFRTHFYDVEKVLSAIETFEVKPQR